MREMNEVNGLLILVGIGVKEGAVGRDTKRAERVLKKIPLPAVKIKKGRGEIKNICPQK